MRLLYLNNLKLGTVFDQNNVRPGKHDNVVEEVDLVYANLEYACVKRKMTLKLLWLFGTVRYPRKNSNGSEEATSYTTSVEHSPQYQILLS